MRNTIRVLVALMTAMAAADVRAAQLGFTFQTIADTTSTVPGQAATFTGFGVPSNSGFTGTFAIGSGLYAFGQPFGSSTIRKVADTTTPVPFGTGNFTAFDAPSVSYYFHATGPNGQDGIYAYDNSRSDPSTNLNAKANTQTVPPTGAFATFGTHAASGDGGQVFFQAQLTTGQPGIYAVSNTNRALATTIADTNTVVPNRGGEKFSGFGPVVGQWFGSPAFLGLHSGGTGLYIRNFFGNIVPRYDSTTVINGTGGTTLGSILAFSTDDVGLRETIAIIAHPQGKPDEKGVFKDSNPGGSQFVDELAKVGDPVTGRTAVFTDFTNVGYYPSDFLSNRGALIAFRGVGSDGEAGIYAVLPDESPIPLRVIDTTMALDGKQISGISMSDSAVYGYNITFRATFDDGSSGIYTASTPGFVPEPAALAFAAPLSLLLITRRRPQNR